MAKKTKNKKEKKERKLNLQQEEFCQMYTGKDTEVFGNGAQCYLAVCGKAYMLKHKKPMSYQVAAVDASQLLIKPNVLARINELLETGGFNSENVDKQHLFLINQHADLKTKMAAIREFNELKSRIQKKVDVNLSGSISLTELFNQSQDEDKQK